MPFAIDQEKPTHTAAAAPLCHLLCVLWNCIHLEELFAARRGCRMTRWSESARVPLNVANLTTDPQPWLRQTAALRAQTSALIDIVDNGVRSPTYCKEAQYQVSKSLRQLNFSVTRTDHTRISILYQNGLATL